MKLAYIASLLLVGLCCVAAAGAATEKDEPVDTAALDLARCMELLTAFDFSEPACFKKVIVKLLGFAVIAGAFSFKLPQIKKLVDAQDATGLSFMSTYVESACYLTVAMYHILQGNPVSAWGENAIISVQNVVLIAYMWKFTSASSTHVIAAVVGFVALLAFELSLPAEYHSYLFSATIPAFSAARIPQIIENFRNGHTGQLALITLGMGFAGSLARVFTSLEEVEDLQVALSFVLGAVWNTILLVQVFLYWNKTNEVLAAIKDAKTK